MKATNDQTWREHMKTGDILEEITNDNYRMVLVKVTQQSSFIHYHYRLIVFTKESSEPILSLNLESCRMFRTCCLGAHISEGHDNLGVADINMSQSSFRTWALDMANRYLGIGQSPPPSPDAIFRPFNNREKATDSQFNDREKATDSQYSSSNNDLNKYGKKLIALPEPGIITNYDLVKLLKETLPNTSGAWSHVVPALVKYSKHKGKRSLFGRDKGKKAYRILNEKLYLVVLGLYADGVLSPGGSVEDCLIALLRSLVCFKEAFPNWTDAYSIAYQLFVEEKEKAKQILLIHQYAVEKKIV